MAHELGHAVHGMMAKDHLYLHSTLPLAETASVFGERFFRPLMSQERNKAVRQDC